MTAAPDARRAGWLVAHLAVVLLGASAEAQTVASRGFVEAGVRYFPQEGSHDPENVVGGVTARAELVGEPEDWLRWDAVVEVRGNTHEQVGNDWSPDFTDRGLTRPPLSVRRLSATMFRGPFTLDAGRQFIRWGRTDILAPTDRFAPRDYLNVIDNDFLAVTGLRARLSDGFDSLDMVWVPLFTPSRIPLLDQRWGAVTGIGPPPVRVERGREFPGRWQGGVRWERIASGLEFAAAYYDGFTNVPVVQLAEDASDPVRRFPGQRMWGGDLAYATRWFTVKSEAGYFQSRDRQLDDYVLWVLQLERQSGEWLIIAGYAGEVVAATRPSGLFSPDRGVARSVLASASYTIDANRRLAFETALRDTAEGLYVKGEYSQARGQHWRTTIGASFLAGSDDDFLGQYRRNSHVTAALRYSF